MADTSASYDLGAIATSSDAASDAASKAQVAQSTGSDAASAASDALSKIAAVSDVASQANAKAIAASSVASNALSKATAGGAPTNAGYVTLATNATLSDERVLTAGVGVKLTDAGAGSTITVAPDFDVVNRHCWIHEHFDGLTTASIIGQGSYNEMGAWVDDGLAAGSTALVAVKSGADKMLSIMNKGAAGATNSYIASICSSKTFLNGGGYFHVKARVDQDSAGYGGRFMTLADTTGGAGIQTCSVYFRYNTTFQLAFWNGSGFKIQDCSKNTWYTIDGYWAPAGSTGGQVTIFIDGAFAYKGATAVSTTKWDRLGLSAYSPAGGSDCTMDVDDLIVSSIMPLGVSL